MNKFSRKYHSPDGKIFDLDDLEERLWLISGHNPKLDEAYLDETNYETAYPTKEKTYLLLPSGEGISGELLQYNELTRNIAQDYNLKPNEDVSHDGSMRYLSSLSYEDATLLLDKMNLRLPSLEEYVSLIRMTRTSELRRLNGEPLQVKELKEIHYPIPEKNGWTAEYLADRILYVPEKDQWHSAHQESLETKVPLIYSGILEKYGKEVEAAGGSLSLILPPVKNPENPSEEMLQKIEEENWEPKVPIFLTYRNPQGKLHAILDCRADSGVLLTGTSIGIRPVYTSSRESDRNSKYGGLRKNV